MDRKILVAEDSLTIQKVFELAFTRSGYQVTYVDKGEELKNRVPEVNPDLIICDVTLPDENGYSVVGDIKKVAESGGIPTLLLVGSLESLNEEKYRESGADGYLYKPFEAQELLDKVEGMIRDRGDLEEGVTDEKGQAPKEEEGWDFSDVFEDVDMGSEASDEEPAHDTFIEELVKESEPVKMESVEDFDVALEDISSDEIVPLEKEKEIYLSEEKELSLSHEDEEAAEEVKDIDIGLDELEEMDKSISSLSGNEGTYLADGKSEEASRGGEEKVMEEVARDVEDFPISSGYEVACHIRLNDKSLESGEVMTSSDALDKGLTTVLTSDQFRKGLQGVAGEIVEKILWDVFPAMMEGMRKEILLSIKEVATEVIPGVASKVIEEEIRKIREELDSME